LEIRPVWLRRADRTQGHAVVSLLALKLARELDRRVAPLGLTVEDAVERLQGVRLVCLGDPAMGLWRLADSYPVAQTEVLGVLPKLPAPVLSLGKVNARRLKNHVKAARRSELCRPRLPKTTTPKWGNISLRIRVASACSQPEDRERAGQRRRFALPEDAADVRMRGHDCPI
jgi:hypothetical protein